MVARRGTSNTNDRGNSRQRKQRREAMVQNWRADTDARDRFGVLIPADTGDPDAVPACRCWRCGKLLTADTVTIDRWPVPGIDGGKYTVTNTRPACDKCNPTTGATIRKGDSHQLQILVLELES